ANPCRPTQASADQSRLDTGCQQLVSDVILESVEGPRKSGPGHNPRAYDPLSGFLRDADRYVEARDRSSRRCCLKLGDQVAPQGTDGATAPLTRDEQSLPREGRLHEPLPGSFHRPCRPAAYALYGAGIAVFSYQR